MAAHIHQAKRLQASIALLEADFHRSRDGNPLDNKLIAEAADRLIEGSLDELDPRMLDALSHRFGGPFITDGSIPVDKKGRIDRHFIYNWNELITYRRSTQSPYAIGSEDQLEWLDQKVRYLRGKSSPRRDLNALLSYEFGEIWDQWMNKSLTPKETYIEHLRWVETNEGLDSQTMAALFSRMRRRYAGFDENSAAEGCLPLWHEKDLPEQWKRSDHTIAPDLRALLERLAANLDPDMPHAWAPKADHDEHYRAVIALIRQIRHSQRFEDEDLDFLPEDIIEIEQALPGLLLANSETSDTDLEMLARAAQGRVFRLPYRIWARGPHRWDIHYCLYSLESEGFLQEICGDAVMRTLNLKGRTPAWQETVYEESHKLATILKSIWSIEEIPEQEFIHDLIQTFHPLAKKTINGIYVDWRAPTDRSPQVQPRSIELIGPEHDRIIRHIDFDGATAHFMRRENRPFVAVGFESAHELVEQWTMANQALCSIIDSQTDDDERSGSYAYEKWTPWLTQAMIRDHHGLGQVVGHPQDIWSPACMNCGHFTEHKSAGWAHDKETGLVQGYLCRSCSYDKGLDRHWLRWFTGESGTDQLLPNCIGMYRPHGAAASRVAREPGRLIFDAVLRAGGDTNQAWAELIAFRQQINARRRQVVLEGAPMYRLTSEDNWRGYRFLDPDETDPSLLNIKNLFSTTTRQE